MSPAHPTGSGTAEADETTSRPARQEILDRSLRLGGALVAVFGALSAWDLLVGTWRVATGQVEGLYTWLGALGTPAFGVDPLGIVALVGLSLVAAVGTIAAGVRTVRDRAPVLGMSVAAFWLLGRAPQWWLAAIPLAAYAGLAAAGPLRAYAPGADEDAHATRRGPTRIASVLLVVATLLAIAVAQGWLGTRPVGLVGQVGLVVGALGATVAATRTDEPSPDTIALGGAAVGVGMALAGAVASFGAALALVAAVFLAVPDRVREALEELPVPAGTDRPSRGVPAGDRPAGLRPGAVFEDRYDVRSRLGADETGRTFLARDGLVGRDVVLKELSVDDDGRIEAVLRDAHAVAGLDHPRLASLHDVVRTDDRAVLVVEHVPAGSLDDRIHDGPLDRDRALEVADQILEGLAAIHQVGVVHGRLTPDNVLFADDDTVRLTDVGVHRLGEREDPYRAPEEDPDARADLHAVAALVAVMLTGDPGGDVEGEIGDRLDKGLADDPDDRFADAEAMREALAELRD